VTAPGRQSPATNSAPRNVGDAHFDSNPDVQAIPPHPGKPIRLREDADAPIFCFRY